MNRWAMVAVLALAVSGCAELGNLQAQVEADKAKLRQLTTADVQAALDIATQYQDAAGVQCYTYLLTRLQAPDDTPQVKGVVSAFERARVVIEGGQDRLEELNVACAALITDATATIARLAARFGL